MRLLTATLITFLLIATSAIASDSPASHAVPAAQPATATPPTTPAGKDDRAKKIWEISKLIDDAHKAQEENRWQDAQKNMLDAAQRLAKLGMERDQVSALREMTLENNAGYANAGARAMAEYYYKKYLHNKPRDAQWLLEALAWAHYASANDLLKDRFTARRPDKEHENIDERGKQRGEELKADDKLYLASELIRTGQQEALQNTLKEWPYPIDRIHSLQGTSLLHSAVWHKKLDAVRLLVEQHKADINVVDKENDTPLDYANHLRAMDIVKYLKSKGAKANKLHQNSTRNNGQPTLDELKRNNPAALQLPQDKSPTTPSSAAAPNKRTQP